MEQVLATGTPRADAMVTRFVAFASGAVVGVSAAALGVVAGVYFGIIRFAAPPLSAIACATLS